MGDSKEERKPLLQNDSRSVYSNSTGEFTNGKLRLITFQAPLTSTVTNCGKLRYPKSLCPSQ